MAKITKARSVADGVLRVPAAARPGGVPRWLDELDMWASAHLREDKDRPGAAVLREVRGYYSKFRNAVGNNPDEAVWAAMRLLHAMWIAQMFDARQMIESGVTSFRGQERENRKREAQAAARHAEWQKAAEGIWKRRPDLSVNATANLIANRDGGSASTIRQAIKKPAKS